MAQQSMSGSALGRVLNEYARHYAQRERLLHDTLPHPRSNTAGSILFGADSDGRHGNFYAASYRAILAHPAWRARLTKTHTAAKRARALSAWAWRELDCAVSSDALLMNIFCCPKVSDGPALRSLLGVAPGAEATFGVRPRLPLCSGATDTTEIDMQIGDLLVEAKLTESGFQTAGPALVERLRDVESVFDLAALPRSRGRALPPEWNEAEQLWQPVVQGKPGHYLHYQLIRGVMAAHATGLRFCVLCDARRTDLRDAWASVQAAVSEASLRWRLQLVTWQEIAGALPEALRGFLAGKYGMED